MVNNSTLTLIVNSTPTLIKGLLMMRLLNRSVLLAALGSAATALAGPAQTQVVIVKLCVAEQQPERVEHGVTTPLERILIKLPGVETLHSNTGYGSATLEVHFKGGASEDDRTSVDEAVGRSDVLRESRVLSRSTELGAARPEQLFSSGRDCAPARL